MKREQQVGVTERIAIIVAGMHRSGTSVTTRIVSLLGAELARDLIPAGIGNECGHWESRAVQDLNNDMLASLGSDLYSPVDFSADWFVSAAARQWIDRIGDLLADEYSNATFFVLKDPRIALFLPLWLEAMRQLSIVPRFVLPFRHPDAVAASLETRERRLGSGNALPYAQGVAVWLRYVLAAERFTRGQARTFVAFDRVLADWRGEFTRMGRQLGLNWPNWRYVDREIEDFLDSGARSHGTGNPVNEVAGISGNVHASLAQAVLEPDSTYPVFDAAAQAVSTARDVFGPHIVARERAFADLRRRADSAAQRHDIERADLHDRFAVEIGLRDARIVEASAHARRIEEAFEKLQQEHASVSDYAKSLAQDRDRAIEYALSLQTSRDEALEYAQALEQARNEATR
jgi:hypothetical protein